MRKLFWFIIGGFITWILTGFNLSNQISNGDVIEETDEHKITRMKKANGEYSSLCWYEAKEKVEESN